MDKHKITIKLQMDKTFNSTIVQLKYIIFFLTEKLKYIYNSISCPAAMLFPVGRLRSEMQNVTVTAVAVRGKYFEVG